MSKVILLDGQRFGRLAVLRRSGSNYHSRASWLCRCDCGTEKVISGQLLRRGQISCGCFRLERAVESSTTHGLGNHELYGTWLQMINRCEDKSQHEYANYGGRGIAVCERWHDLRNFVADMHPRPLGLTLDRWPDNNGDYRPGNVRWATAEEQGANMRTNHLMFYLGRTQTVTQWARELGLNSGLIFSRLHKLGWSVEMALSTPVDTRYGPRRKPATPQPASAPAR